MSKKLRVSLTLAAALASPVVGLVGAKAMASDALQIEQVAPNNTVTVQYDNAMGVGYDPSSYPVITALLSQPGTFGGHAYTGWSALAADQTGSLDLFVSAATLAALPGTPPAGTATTSLAVGEGVNVDAQYDPFDGIAELAFSTSATKGNYLAVTSTGNTLPAVPVVTIPGLESATSNGTTELATPSITGQYLELQNVTISGTGAFATVFPTFAQANTTTETYSITDSLSNTMELFDWVTSYSNDGALGGTPVPTGPVDIYGFYDSFNEFVPSVIVPVPEPASMGVLAISAAMLLRRKARKT